MALIKLNHTTIGNQVVRMIRRMIFSGILKAGDRVIESKIAKELEISRGPVREALKEIENEGLVVYYPRKGTYVVNLSYKDIEEIYTLRALLESYAVSLTIDNISEQDIERIKTILDDLDKAVEKNDILEAAQHNMRFHEKIIKLSGHKRILTVWKSLYVQIRMLSGMTTEYYLDIKLLRKHHKKLMDSLIMRDKVYAKECFEEHILISMEKLIASLKQLREKNEI